MKEKMYGFAVLSFVSEAPDSFNNDDVTTACVARIRPADSSR